VTIDLAFSKNAYFRDVNVVANGQPLYRTKDAAANNFIAMNYVTSPSNAVGTESDGDHKMQCALYHEPLLTDIPNGPLSKGAITANGPLTNIASSQGTASIRIWYMVYGKRLSSTGPWIRDANDPFSIGNPQSATPASLYGTI
jgi:hypothetical protein